MTAVAWPDVLDALARGEDLDEGTAEACMRAMLGGEASPVQIAAFLLALRTKGETVAELATFLATMQAMALTVRADGVVVDTCGTGGDRARTVNVSTMAALVVAGAGVKVAKHGNRAVSSACGSADVLDALGVATELPAKGVEACIEEAGIGFMFAPAFHPGMKHVMPVRRELGVRTLFNLIAPLANPAAVRRQTVGVGDPQTAPKIAHVLAHRGVDRAMVFCGDDGLDELTTTTTSHVWDIDGGVQPSMLDPSELGIERATVQQLAGGSPEENARIFTAVLSGSTGAVRDAVALNAAAALVVAGSSDSFDSALDAARASIDSGAAARALDALRDTSQRFV
ncbi:MAG: anthranilate phosphoribosyltransferase [Actinomycetota bacterium]|nr:anthranilate phosphoribosyltransferase [Actinomycetota bacterium]